MKYIPPTWEAEPQRDVHVEYFNNGEKLGVIGLTGKTWFSIGSENSDCDLPLSDSTLSDLHAVVQFKNDGELYLYRLGATSTEVGGVSAELERYVKLSDGNTVDIGSSGDRLIFRIGAKSSDAALIQSATQKWDEEVMTGRNPLTGVDPATYMRNFGRFDTARLLRDFKAKLPARRVAALQEVVDMQQQLVTLEAEVAAKEKQKIGFDDAELKKFAALEKRVASLETAIETAVNDRVLPLFAVRGDESKEDPEAEQRRRLRALADEQRARGHDSDDELFDRTAASSAPSRPTAGVVHTDESLVRSVIALDERITTARLSEVKHEQMALQARDKAKECEAAGDEVEAFMQRSQAETLDRDAHALRTAIRNMESELSTLRGVMRATNVKDPLAEREKAQAAKDSTVVASVAPAPSTGKVVSAPIPKVAAPPPVRPGAKAKAKAGPAAGLLKGLGALAQKANAAKQVQAAQASAIASVFDIDADDAPAAGGEETQTVMQRGAVRLAAPPPAAELATAFSRSDAAGDADRVHDHATKRVGDDTDAGDEGEKESKRPRVGSVGPSLTDFTASVAVSSVVRRDADEDESGETGVRSRLESELLGADHMPSSSLLSPEHEGAVVVDPTSHLDPSEEAAAALLSSSTSGVVLAADGRRDQIVWETGMPPEEKKGRVATEEVFEGGLYVVKKGELIKKQ